ncbi:MAG: hypothetical protein ACLTXH_05545 [Enterobacter hormaechei]
MKATEKADQAVSAEKALSIRLRRQRGRNPCIWRERCQACSRAARSVSFAWFIQSVTPRFKEALRWMAANRKPTTWLTMPS